MSLTISAVEDAIVTNLKTALSKSHVEAYPDDWDSFKVNRNDTVLVQWQGIETIKDATTDLSVQHIMNQYAVLVFNRNKRKRGGHQGGYDTLNTIYNNLQGHKIGKQYLSRQSERLLSRDSKTGLWIFRAVYNHFQITDL